MPTSPPHRFTRMWQASGFARWWNPPTRCRRRRSALDPNAPVGDACPFFGANLVSFTPVERRVPPRLYRSKLFVPGSRPALFEKAAAGEADVVCLDLEDSVAPAGKEKARDAIVAALNDIGWGEKFVTARINGLETHWCYRDVLALVEEGGERLDAIMIPKVGTAHDIYAIDMLITQASKAVGRNKMIGIEAIIETAAGLTNIDAIAASSPRLE